jgi:hypothetical protein
MNDLIARLEGFRNFMLRSADRWPDMGAYHEQLELVENAINTLTELDHQMIHGLADPH